MYKEARTRVNSVCEDFSVKISMRLSLVLSLHLFMVHDVSDDVVLMKNLKF